MLFQRERHSPELRSHAHPNVSVWHHTFLPVWNSQLLYFFTLRSTVVFPWLCGIQQLPAVTLHYQLLPWGTLHFTTELHFSTGTEGWCITTCWFPMFLQWVQYCLLFIFNHNKKLPLDGGALFCFLCALQLLKTLVYGIYWSTNSV